MTREDDQMKARIEIQMSIEDAHTLNELARKEGRTRKNFIEQLCFQRIEQHILSLKALAKKIKKKKITSTELPTKRKSSNGR